MICLSGFLWNFYTRLASYFCEAEQIYLIAFISLPLRISGFSCNLTVIMVSNTLLRAVLQTVSEFPPSIQGKPHAYQSLIKFRKLHRSKMMVSEILEWAYGMLKVRIMVGNEWEEDMCSKKTLTFCSPVLWIYLGAPQTSVKIPSQRIEHSWRTQMAALMSIFCQVVTEAWSRGKWGHVGLQQEFQFRAAGHHGFRCCSLIRLVMQRTGKWRELAQDEKGRT